MIKLAKQYQDAQSTALGKAATLIGNLDAVINLSIGDPDQITHESVINATMEDAKKGHTKYTHALGDLDVRNALQNHFYKEYALSIPTDEMIMVVGAGHGMYLGLKAILNPGDEVLVPDPHYPPYLQQVLLNQGIPVSVPTLEKDNFHLSVESLETAITPKTRALMLNNPNNPTGASLSKEELSAIVDFAKANDLIILSDEVYRGFSFDKDFTPLYQIEGARERTIVLGSFSKDYAMTGWRIGYAFGPKHVISCMRELNEGICFTAPSISQRAALHALNHHKEILESLRNEYKARVDYVYNRIQTIPGISMHKPEATFYLFISIKETGLTSEAFCDKAMEEAQVLLLPGTAFGVCGEGYVRIACTVAIPKLKEAFDRLETLSY
jgi:aspartate/methionine/tyrosine aminotransferase